MDYTQKRQLLNNFLQEWHIQFRKIPHLLKFISSYPELQKKLNDLPILESDEINESQLEWISLISQFNNPIETVFFKPWWVPFTKDEYEYFIDLSSEMFMIFRIHFYWNEPYHWYIEIVMEDTTRFLLSVDDTRINIDAELKRNKILWLSYMKNLSQHS